MLILSRFAGAADECEDALLVNPYDSESVARALLRALAMPLNERRERHRKLRASIAKSTDWSERFLHSLKQLEEAGNNGDAWLQLAA
jgi:trehalose 6-phosphate synthase